MERGFNAGPTHSSIYQSIFNSLRAIARYWSENATFSYPLHLTGAKVRGVVGGVPIGIPGKIESWGYQAVKKL